MGGKGKSLGQIIEVERDLVRPFADQPRKYFDKAALNDLARSIKAAGQQVPITVRRLSGDAAHNFELIDGQRRWLACGIIGQATMTAWVKDEVHNAHDQFLASVVANFAREGHGPIEIANAIARLRQRPEIRDLPKGEQAQRIADIFGRSETWVYQMESLMRLHPDVRGMMHPAIEGGWRLKWYVALLLVPLPEDAQLKLAKRITRQGLGIGNARRIVDAYLRDEGVGTVHTDRMLPGRQRERLLTALNVLDSQTEALLDLTIADFKRMFENRPRGEQESVLHRIDRYMESLEQLRSVVARMLTSAAA